MGNYKVTANYKPDAGSGITETSEASSTPVTDDNVTGMSTDKLFLGNQITLPTTEKFYKITAIECKNGATVSGSMVMGACEVDGSPPVDNHFLVLAYTPLTSQSGTSTTQKVNVSTSVVLLGGTKVTGFLTMDNGTGECRYLATSNQKGEKTAYGAQAPPTHDGTSIAWGNTTVQLYLKLYFKGYK